MARKLENRVAVVTGSGRGLGRAEALALAAEGARIVVNDVGCNIDGTDISSSPAASVVEEIKRLGSDAVANFSSVSTPDGAADIIKSAIDTFGRLDILVNNAGIVRDRMVFNMTDEEWDSVIKVHLYGHFYCTRAACFHFRKQKSGRIINTSSMAGLGMVGQSNYSAAKEGIVGFTRTVAIEMSRYGVTCNAIRPFAATRLFTPEIQESWSKLINKGIPMPDSAKIDEIARLSPEMIAPLVVFLATDEATGINGKSFYISGGRIGIFSEPEITREINKVGTWTVAELAENIPNKLMNT